MKKIIFPALCLFVVLCIGGCANTLPTFENESTANVNEVASMENDFFDLNMLHKPTKSDILTVHKGMPYYSIVDIIGKPHGYADGISHGMAYKWITVEGDTYTIMFLPNDPVPNAATMSLSEYHQYTVAVSDPTISIENQAMKYQEYFDNTKDHHPTEEQIMSVCSGMTLSDAIDIIGKPHGFGPTSGIMTLEWEADTGKVYVAMVALPDEKIDIGIPSTVENILSYGVILATPSIMRDYIHNK